MKSRMLEKRRELAPYFVYHIRKVWDSEGFSYMSPIVCLLLALVGLIFTAGTFFNVLGSTPFALYVLIFSLVTATFSLLTIARKTDCHPDFERFRKMSVIGFGILCLIDLVFMTIFFSAPLPY